MLSIQQLLNPVHDGHLTPESPVQADAAGKTPTRSTSSPPRLRSLQAPITPRRTRSSTPILSSPLSVLAPPTSNDTLLATRHNVYLNRKTILQTLYHYGIGTALEYPETSESADCAIGHLFEMSPEDWINPCRSFAYSQGLPKGQSKPEEQIFCKLLVDDSGNEVPCRRSHTTCMSFCPS